MDVHVESETSRQDSSAVDSRTALLASIVDSSDDGYVPPAEYEARYYEQAAVA